MATATSVSKKGLKLVLIGRKGDGKSSTGNTVLGNEKPAFQTSINDENGPRISQICRAGLMEMVENDTMVTVIDTPGLFNTEVSTEHTENELSNIFKYTQNEIDAFLLVLRIGRFTAELQNTIEYYTKLFGSNIMKRTIVVFTGLDDLEFDGQTFKEYFDQLPTESTEKLQKGHCLGINNRSKDEKVKQQQSKEILDLARKISTQGKFKFRNLPSKSPLIRAGTSTILATKVANQSSDIPDGDNDKVVGSKYRSLPR